MKPTIYETFVGIKVYVRRGDVHLHVRIVGYGLMHNTTDVILIQPSGSDRVEIEPTDNVYRLEKNTFKRLFQ